MGKKLTYFAISCGSSPVEIDAELAQSLYRATTMTFKDNGQAVEDWHKADALFEIGEKVYPSSEDDTTYVYGMTLTKKDRFKMVLKHGIQTKEEYRAKNKQG